MVEQKKRRREGTDTEPAMVKAIRQVFQEVEELREERDRSREENERLKLKIAKLEAGCRTPQEEEKEVELLLLLRYAPVVRACCLRARTRFGSSTRVFPSSGTSRRGACSTCWRGGGADTPGVSR